MVVVEEEEAGAEEVKEEMAEEPVVEPGSYEHDNATRLDSGLSFGASSLELGALSQHSSHSRFAWLKEKLRAFFAQRTVISLTWCYCYLARSCRNSEASAGVDPYMTATL
uniref:Uncharacterized protein n=1 Tax=Haptolina brevifila TaxID=156173 RepID=A0A7S2D028_9EUKA|mmetsp:Transcript_31027/g.62150  ORF Transcript_31027/g.62150 Transcript_31027/m.62150 type:complete len:110 (+) Transcript_31027:439-768(+)